MNNLDFRGLEELLKNLGVKKLVEAKARKTNFETFLQLALLAGLVILMVSLFGELYNFAHSFGVR